MKLSIFAVASSEDRGKLEDPIIAGTKEKAIQEARDNGGHMLMEQWTIEAETERDGIVEALNYAISGILPKTGATITTRRFARRVGGPAW